MFKALIKEDYSIAINIERYQDMLEHALSKVDFSVDTGIYMLPSDLNLNMWKTKGYYNKILVNNTGMKIGSKRDISKVHKKLTPPEPIKAEGVAHAAPKMHLMKWTDKPLKDHLVVQRDQTDNPKRHAEEKLAITFLIVGTGLIAYHFW